MKILVCISEVPDTTTKVKFINEKTALDHNGVQWILNPWDELSLSRAIELKETSGGLIDNITVIHVGTKESEPTIRKALAIGADNAIRIDTKATDAHFTAFQIAEVIKEQAFDIIMVGIDSADYNGSAVGGMIAALLDYTVVSSVSGIKLENNAVIVNREIDAGTEVLEVKTPCIAIVQKGIAIEPKIAAMRGIMMARTKPLQVLTPKDINTLTEITQFEMPEAKGGCKKFTAEQVSELVSVLRNEAKLI